MKTEENIILKKAYKSKNGITLIALVVTIIVILIIAGVVLVTLMSENGIINKTSKAAFIKELTEVDEIVQLELVGNALKVYSGESQDIIFTPDLKVTESEVPSTMKSELEALDGEISNLYWVPAKFVEGKEKMYMYETKIKVVFKPVGLRILGKTIHSIKGASVESPPEEPPTIASMDVSLSYGYYEPDLNGFDLDNTYIIYYSSDCSQYYDQMTLRQYLELGKPKTYNLTVNNENVTYYFHDYKEDNNNSIWGNVVTKANGLEAWWVWTPRYAYKIEDSENSKVDAVFTDISNNSLNESKPFTADNMGNYIPHPAFDLENGSKKLKGIWMAKHAADLSQAGNETLDNGGARYYAPNLKGYNINSTYIATYDINGDETGKTYLLKNVLASGYQANTDGVLISGTVDTTKFDTTSEYWYNYSKSIWANIKTYANNLEAWWVWIPRYAYMMGTQDKNIDIAFITTENKLFDGDSNLGEFYIPHPAFTLKGGKELEGIWMAKHAANGTFTAEDGTINNE